MKTIYEAPSAEVIDLRAMESVALLDGHPDEKRAATKAGDAPDASLGNGQGEPF